jgi:sec-independent protein translocase protein TatC
LGILFGYYIICPLSINFLANYTVSNIIVNNISIDSYLSTVATLALGSGIVFELPIIIFILSKLGIITPKFMRRNRSYASVLILIIAAVVTPTPDIFTMLTVSFPLFVLYEISILVSAKVDRERKKSEVEFYSN